MISEVDIVVGFRSTGDYRTEACLEKCVETVERFTPTPHRWIFVDDNSDQSGQMVVGSVAGKFPNSVLIRTHSQNWFSRAYNKGLRLVRTRKAVILNSDTEMGEGWLEELESVWEDVEQRSSQKVALVGSVLNTSIPERWICTRPPNYVTMHAVLLDMPKCFEAAEKRGTPGLIFDETSPLTIHIRSDVELSHWLNRIGYETVASYKSAVGHHGGKSWGHLLGTIPSSLDSVRGL